MNEKCKGKEPYFSAAEAEATRDSLQRFAKRSGKGGRSFRRLIVYQCGGHFHIGRDCSQRIRKMAEISRTKPVKKIPSLGELKRRLRNIEERLEGEKHHRLHVLGKEIAAAARREAEEDARRAELAARLADLQDSVRIAASL